MDGGGTTWFDDELAGCDFGDQRLNKRLRLLVEQIEGAMGDSIPLACQDWANTKAAYRFLSHDRVCEADIFAGHFQSTRSRSAATDDMLLVLHDTTEFSFQRDDPSQIGLTREYRTGKDADRRKPPRKVCGILMHSSLVTTVEGVPLGIAAVKFWTRNKFKGSAALKRKVNPTRVPIGEKESVRWLDNLAQSTELLGAPERCVHVGDRESDIFELFCIAEEVGTHFVVRACNNRRAGDGDHTVEEEMEETAVIRSLRAHRPTTLADNMPSSHRRYRDYTHERIAREAAAIGDDTAALVEIILCSRPHPEQGFRSCIGILSLTKRYGAERVDAACARALAIGTRSYSSVAAILKNAQDKKKAADKEQPSLFHENIRGPGYYR